MSRKKILNAFSYLLTLVFLAILFYIFLSKKELQLLLRIDLFSFTVLIIFTLLFYALGGLQYYALRDIYAIRLEKKDIILLPLAMNLWSFIVPLQGSSIFFMLFLKYRHQVKISDAFSITIFIYLVTVFIAGIAGLAFAIIYNMVLSLFSVISLIFLLNPLLVIVVHKIVKSLPDINVKFIGTALLFFRDTIHNVNNLWLNYKYLALSFFLIFCRMLLCAFWYMWIAHILGYRDVPFLSLLLLALWMTVSLIIRFTPNNWGVLQLISGLMFSLIALPPAQGAMISLVASAALTIIAFTMGVAANFYYMKCWNIKSLKEIS
jgi:hypothetical protein